MSNIFNDNMTIDEARNLLFAEAEGKTKAEKKKLLSELDMHWGAIVENDMKVNKDYMV